MNEVKSIVILGGGESGVGAALLAAKLGMNAFVSDYGKLGDVFRMELENAGIHFEENGHMPESWGILDLIVKSPGIPPNAKIVLWARKNRIPVISEIEFAFRHCPHKIMAITGSNGKTTTTKLAHHILVSAGIKAAIGGNYGVSFSRLLHDENDLDWLVLEISSFQLEDINSFRPDLAAILNITADHLDRYEYDIHQYAKAKYKMVMNMQSSDHLLVNESDSLVMAHLIESKTAARIERLNINNLSKGVYSKELDTNFEINLKGKHNLFNAGVAIRLAQMVGVSDELIQKALSSFRNDPHRLEYIAKIDGVHFVNDSKATNVDACYYALDGVESPIIWIAGGTDKGNDYTSILPIVEEKVAHLICIGKDNRPLLQVFENKIKTLSEAASMDQAVQSAFSSAHSGDTVLLSPACASFDLYKNYIDRGDQFRAAVWHLLD